MNKRALVLGCDRYSTFAEVLRNNGYVVFEVQTEVEVYALWPKPGFGLVLIDDNFVNWDIVVNWLTKNQYAGPAILLTSKTNKLYETCRDSKLAFFNTVVICDKDINCEIIPSIISTIIEIGMAKECQLVN